MSKEDLKKLLEATQKQLKISYDAILLIANKNENINHHLENNDLELSENDREVLNSISDLYRSTKNLESVYKQYVKEED